MAATQKMIDYAKSIANKLNLDEPDFSSYNETSSFISEHSVAFKRIVNNERLVNSLENTYGDVCGQFSNKFIEVLNDLCEIKGLYVFWVDNEIVYIGKSVNLQERIYSSLKERIKSAPITHLTTVLTPTEADMHIGEVLLITEYKPDLNCDCACEDVSEKYRSGINLYDMPKIQIFIDSEGKRWIEK